jgi:hypothetical protein
MALAPTINLPETDAAFLHLLTIKASTDVIRIVNNNEPIVSNGYTFQPYPFALALPMSDGERQTELVLNVDNVDQMLVHAIRELLEPPTVKFEMVLSISPDTVERTIDFLRADLIEYNAMQIQFRLRPDNIMGRKFPSSKYTPAQYPDLHYR